MDLGRLEFDLLAPCIDDLPPATGRQQPEQALIGTAGYVLLTLFAARAGWTRGNRWAAILLQLDVLP
jgi:hypothetical protein